MNIIFALLLLLPVMAQPACMHEVGCERFNCQDYTEMGITVLRFHDFNAYPMCGWYAHSQHVWIGVEIDGEVYHVEPQGAELVFPSTVDDYAPTSYTYFGGHPCVARGMTQYVM